MPSSASAKAKAPFGLRKPCAQCPFRSDKPFDLRPGRAKEFADALREGGSFHCHKTVEFADDGEQVSKDTTQWCAGALITMEKEGFSNQQVRIAERLGMYDHTRLDMDAPVYDSLSDWVKSYHQPVIIDGEEVEMEHCGIVGDSCTDPPGYMMGGSAVRSDDEPTCHPEGPHCQNCGNPICEGCLESATPEAAPWGTAWTCENCAE